MEIQLKSEHVKKMLRKVVCFKRAHGYLSVHTFNVHRCICAIKLHNHGERKRNTHTHSAGDVQLNQVTCNDCSNLFARSIDRSINGAGGVVVLLSVGFPLHRTIDGRLDIPTGQSTYQSAWFVCGRLSSVKCASSS